MRVNLLIRSITSQIWPDEQWRILKPELRRALTAGLITGAASARSPRACTGWDLQLTEYGDGHWRATFYVTGQPHSIVGGTAWEPSVWAAMQRRQKKEQRWLRT